jgi:hypothetical protein
VLPNLAPISAPTPPKKRAEVGVLPLPLAPTAVPMPAPTAAPSRAWVPRPTSTRTWEIPRRSHAIWFDPPKKGRYKASSQNNVRSVARTKTHLVSCPACTEMSVPGARLMTACQTPVWACVVDTNKTKKSMRYRIRCRMPRYYGERSSDKCRRVALSRVSHRRGEERTTDEILIASQFRQRRLRKQGERDH